MWSRGRCRTSKALPPLAGASPPSPPLPSHSCTPLCTCRAHTIPYGCLQDLCYLPTNASCNPRYLPTNPLRNIRYSLQDRRDLPGTTCMWDLRLTTCVRVPGSAHLQSSTCTAQLRRACSQVREHAAKSNLLDTNKSKPLTLNPQTRLKPPSVEPSKRAPFAVQFEPRILLSPQPGMMRPDMNRRVVSFEEDAVTAWVKCHMTNI